MLEIHLDNVNQLMILKLTKISLRSTRLKTVLPLASMRSLKDTERSLATNAMVVLNSIPLKSPATVLPS
jgi:hypothetical protein